MVLGLGHPGFLSFFLRLDPGFNIYVGNIKVGIKLQKQNKKLNATLNILFFCKKVFDFKQHGINDGVSHKRIFDAKELI